MQASACTFFVVFLRGNRYNRGRRQNLWRSRLDRLGFVHENYFYGDASANMGKLIYEISFFFYMKVYYPEFFRWELLHPENSVKHFVTDGRQRLRHI